VHERVGKVYGGEMVAHLKISRWNWCSLKSRPHCNDLLGLSW